MTKVSPYVFTIFAFSSLVQQVISQIYCERTSQKCQNGGTCNGYTGQCQCPAGARGSLCQYAQPDFFANSDVCKAASQCANGSLCLGTQNLQIVCQCDPERAGDFCDQPLYQAKCTSDYVDFTFLVESLYQQQAAAVPLLHYDDPACMSYFQKTTTTLTNPLLPTEWVTVKGRSFLRHNDNSCYNAIVTEEGLYSVYTLHYAIRYQTPMMLLQYDSVVTLQCKISSTNASDIQSQVIIRPLHDPDRKLDLHFRNEIQEVFGDMKVLTSTGQPFPVQTVLEVGDIVIFEFSQNPRHNLYGMTLGVAKVEAYPNEITSDVQSTVLIENGCVVIQGAVASLQRSENTVRIYFRAFRFRQSDKLHLIFTITGCLNPSICMCQDGARRRREATTGTASEVHSQGYTVTLKFKRLEENAWPGAPSFESCLKMSEFWSLVTIGTLAMTVAILLVLTLGGAVWFSSRPQK